MKREICSVVLGVLALWGGILAICFPVAYREGSESRYGQGKKGLLGDTVASMNRLTGRIIKITECYVT